MSARLVLLLIIGLCVGALAAIPALARQEQPASGPDPAVAEWTEWPHQVSCEGLPFDPISAFSSPTGVERTNSPQVRAMKKFIGGVGDEEFVRRHDWRLLNQTPGIAEYASGRLGGELEYILVQKSRGHWHFSTYSSNCEPASVRRGVTAITWTLDPKQPQLSPRTRKISVYLGPGECNDGKSQNDRLQKPEFREQNGALLMALWLRPVSPGYHNCVGTIEPPVVIRLPEPLGNRRLLDGGTYPPSSGREDIYGG